jgi:hypothetical protein
VGAPACGRRPDKEVVRYIGMDVHREFAQLAVAEDGLVGDEGRIGVTPEALREWAAGLRPDDQVALEATGNSGGADRRSSGWSWRAAGHVRPG